MPLEELEAGIDKLTSDINNGVWLEKYGQLKQQQYYDAGYRILVF